MLKLLSEKEKEERRAEREERKKVALEYEVKVKELGLKKEIKLAMTHGISLVVVRQFKSLM